MKLISLVAIMGLANVTFAVKSSDVQIIRKEVIQLINSKNETLRNGLEYFPWIARFVRLAFHDCAGGCDGCVDLKNSENNGLQDGVEALKKLYLKKNVLGSRRIADVCSLADLYALAAIEGVKLAAAKQPCRRFCTPVIPKLQFKYGRKTPKDCSKLPERKFPSANDGYTKTMAYFKNEFGFSPREVTALLGVHSLGRAVGEVSGFRGPWVRRLGVLNNEYFRDLSDEQRKWGQVLLNKRKHINQWTWDGVRGGTPMMLNADMCLMKDVKTSDQYGRASCTYSTCGDSPTAKYVLEFAKDNTLWMKEFSAVFQKLIEHKSPGLRHPDTV